MNPEPILQEIETKFSKAAPSKCPFCQGQYDQGRCIMCARTTEILREVRVMREQLKKHHNWKCSYSTWLSTGGIRGSRKYKRPMEIPQRRAKFGEERDLINDK